MIRRYVRLHGNLHAVARYRDGNRTDRSDAIAILEAGRNEAIDAVPVKMIEQRALTSLHRLRSAYVADRTARINTVRGILREFGHTVPQGSRTFVAHARVALADEELPQDLRDELGRAFDAIVAFKKTIDEITDRDAVAPTSSPRV
jgi:transposase